MRLPFRENTRCPVQFATVALCVIASIADVSAQSRIPNAARCDFDVVPRIFDGMEVSTIRLRLSGLTLITDTFGLWAPLDQPLNGASFSLRHRRNPGISLNLYVLTIDQASQATLAWEQHLARTKAQLGDAVATSGLMDSADGPPASRTIGWRTREVAFTWGANHPEGARQEQHVFANDGRLIAVFVLAGAAAKLDSARQDFRFFLDRLAPAQGTAR